MKNYIALFIIVISFQVFGQTPFVFEFDYAKYAYDSTSNYIEFYYSFGQNNLSYEKKVEGFLSKANLSIMVRDTVSKKVLLDKQWKIENLVKDSIELTSNKNLIGVLGFAFPKGIYKCRVKGSDGIDSSKSSTIEELFTITPLQDKKIALSDIQLASNIKQEGADPKSIFYKNTLEVYPNPAMLYGQGMPVLFYYIELYNLLSDSAKNSLKLKSQVFNSRGYKVVEKNKAIKISKDSRIEVGTINLAKYPTDTYSLVLSLIDTISNKGVTSAKRFYVFNPLVKDTFKLAKVSNGILSSQFNVLTDEECDDLFEKGKYICSSAESEQYKHLDSVKNKREFLFQFWRRRDKDPSTPENEYYNEYMERVRLCNERYSIINRAGMKTDRGRVYILYGEPDEIERFPSDINRKPYEIWHYNQIEGGVVFDFGDITGFNNYELLNSTKRGELRDDDWENRITSNK